MKRASIILILTVAGLTQTAAGQGRPTFDPNGGEFQISDSKPAGFESFERMYLQTQNSNGRRVKPSGGVEFGQVEYAMQNIVFDGRRWNFETVAVGRVRYKFNGRFLALRRDEHGAIIGDRVLQGILVRFVRGKRSIAANVVFSFIYYSD